MSLILSCNTNDGEKVPRDIIQPELMEQIIFDINFAEIKLLRRSPSVQTQDLQRKHDLAFILNKHDVEDSVFSKSYAFYSINPVLFLDVIERAIKRAEEAEVKLSNADSLSRKAN